MNEFEAIWRNNFGQIPPIGHRLRWEFSDRWIRFHSLPKSKRYPESEEEYSILLNRANTLAGEIFDDGEPFWLAASRPHYQPGTISHDLPPHTKNNHNLPEAFRWFDPIEDVEDRLQWSTFAKQMTWRPGAYDDVFRKIANDEDYAITFAKKDMLSLLIPYDGGFDFILPNAQAVSELKDKHPLWLSNRKDYL